MTITVCRARGLSSEEFNNLITLDPQLYMKMLRCCMQLVWEDYNPRTKLVDWLRNNTTELFYLDMSPYDDEGLDCCFIYFEKESDATALKLYWDDKVEEEIEDDEW